MITDIYQVDSHDSAVNAIGQMTRTVCFCGLEPEMKERITRLANAMIDVGNGLDEVGGMKMWLETRDDDVLLHLKAAGVVDLSEKERLLELSSDGKNLDRKTVGGKIAGFFQDIFMGDNEEYHTYGYVPPVDYVSGEFDYPVMWTYSAYDARLAGGAGHKWDKQAAQEVKQLADEVQMGISSDEVEIVATLHPHGNAPAAPQPS